MTCLNPRVSKSVVYPDFSLELEPSPGIVHQHGYCASFWPGKALASETRLRRRKPKMKHIALATLIALGSATLGLGVASAAPARPAGLNPVQHEMILLSEAMNTILLAVANNNLQAIPPAIHKVHEARLVTEEALLNGEYQPPKNSDQVEAFIAEDEAFHDELVTLMKAVKADDLQAATRQVGVIVNSCTSCHTQYRF